MVYGPWPSLHCCDVVTLWPQRRRPFDRSFVRLFVRSFALCVERTTKRKRKTQKTKTQKSKNLWKLLGRFIPVNSYFIAGFSVFVDL